MSDKIKEALQKLDADNENHWTADGSARLETVKFNNNGEAISREEIEAAFPGFNKASAKDYDWTGPTGDINPGQDADGKDTGVHLDPLQTVDGKDDREGDPNDNPTLGAANPDAPDQRPGQDAEGNLTGVLAPAISTVPPELYNPDVAQPAPAPGSSGAAAAGSLTESPRDDGAGGAAQGPQPGDDPATDTEDSDREAQFAALDEHLAGSDEVEAMEEELAAAEEEAASIRRDLDDLNKRLDEVNRYADKYRGRIAKLKGSENQNTIQQYLESRKRAGQLRGENRATLKEAGLSLKKIQSAVSSAPIDQAMARKNTRGGKRPTRV